MQTFLPYSDFQKSAQCLDYKRLGKQRVEAWQIYLTLKKGEYSICKECQGKGEKNYLSRLPNLISPAYTFCKKCKGKGKIKTPWYNHPIVKMWKGYELALLIYGWCICDEWIKRGFKDSLRNKFINEINLKYYCKYTLSPKWLGNRKFHSAMRSNLLRKDKQYYSKFGWKEPDNLPYVWFK